MDSMGGGGFESPAAKPGGNRGSRRRRVKCPSFQLPASLVAPLLGINRRHAPWRSLICSLRWFRGLDKRQLFQCAFENHPPTIDDEAARNMAHCIPGFDSLAFDAILRELKAEPACASELKNGWFDVWRKHLSTMSEGRSGLELELACAMYVRSEQWRCHDRSPEEADARRKWLGEDFIGPDSDRPSWLDFGSTAFDEDDGTDESCSNLAAFVDGLPSKPVSGHVQRAPRGNFCIHTKPDGEFNVPFPSDRGEGGQRDSATSSNAVLFHTKKGSSTMCDDSWLQMILYCWARGRRFGFLVGDTRLVKSLHAVEFSRDTREFVEGFIMASLDTLLRDLGGPDPKGAISRFFSPTALEARYSQLLEHIQGSPSPNLAPLGSVFTDAMSSRRRKSSIFGTNLDADSSSDGSSASRYRRFKLYRIARELPALPGDQLRGDEGVGVLWPDRMHGHETSKGTFWRFPPGMPLGNRRWTSYLPSSIFCTNCVACEVYPSGIECFQCNGH